MGLQGKTVVVVGGSSGIGLATAEMAKAEGADVVIASRNPQRLKAAGLDYYNHNIDTSPEYYPEIITTRTYDDRLQTLQHVRDAGVMTGGPQRTRRQTRSASRARSTVPCSGPSAPPLAARGHEARGVRLRRATIRSLQGSDTRWLSRCLFRRSEVQDGP